MATDLLLLAAFDPELAPLRLLLGDGLAARIGDRAVLARTCGVGLAASAAGAAAHIAELAPRAVVLVGSCGAYAGAPGAHLALGDVVIAARLRLVDLASVDGLAEFPSPMATSLETDARLCEALAAFAAPGSPRAQVASCVATTLAITVDDAAAARIAARAGADVEHLEAHGVAVACAGRRIPFTAVLGVANFVGSRGRTEWLENHGRAEAAAGQRVVAWLRAKAAASERA